MAVVKEGVHASGFRYKICDDAYVNVSEAELRRRRAETDAIVHRILQEWAKKHPGETLKTSAD